MQYAFPIILYTTTKFRVYEHRADHSGRAV